MVSCFVGLPKESFGPVLEIYRETANVALEFQEILSPLEAALSSFS